MIGNEPPTLDSTPSADPHPVLALLDCPACSLGDGLIPQRDAAAYLACPRCEFWYPIVEEVLVLLPPAGNPQGVRRPLGPAAPFPILAQPARAVDLKALVYSFYARMHEFGTKFNIDKEGLIVDVGCSTGSLAAWLRPDQHYIGFDLSLDSLRFARQASGQYFVQADVRQLPIRSGSVPFFVSREVLEHLDRPEEAVRELRRVGRRGVIVVPTLDFPFLYDPVNWLLTRQGRRARFGIFGYGHSKLHAISGWRRELAAGGFSIEREIGIGSGLLLNASDILWHSLYSWREFDQLPRRGVPITLLRTMSAWIRALHGLDRNLLGKKTASQGFEVR